MRYLFFFFFFIFLNLYSSPLALSSAFEGDQNRVNDSPVKLLQEQGRKFFEKDKKNSFLQFCHTEGAIHVYNALKGMSKAERNRIIVVAIAPAKYIPRSLSAQSFNYGSKRNFIPMIDRGYKRKVYLLEPHKDAPFWDQDFESPTYKNILKDKITDYLKGVSQ